MKPMPVFQAKLSPPHIFPNTLRRPRLVKRLHEGLRRKATLIVAATVCAARRSYNGTITFTGRSPNKTKTLTRNASLQITERQACPEAASASLLPDTGQSVCYSSYDNTSIGCACTGQDGEHSINTMSFTDNGDGTVSDNVTGLMWQKQAANSGYNWYQASGAAHNSYNPDGELDICGNSTLAGRSGWRLPDETELMGIVNSNIYAIC